MKTKIKNSLFLIFCLICIIPYFSLLISGHITLNRHANSTLGVIIGPIVDGGILDGGIGTGGSSDSYSSSPGIPSYKVNEDGSLNAFKQLYVKNVNFNTIYSSDRKYLSFVKYFTIVRTDGRPIYDDDGILDVSNSVITVDLDEVIDYPADLYIRTQSCDYNWKGFLGTVLYSKFKSGAKFNITYYEYFTVGEYTSSVHDRDANTEGAGSFHNSGVNPGFEYYKLGSVQQPSFPYYKLFEVSISGSAYWDNCFWGGTGGDKTFSKETLTNYMKVSDRNWSNTLTATSVKIGMIEGIKTLFSPKPFTAVATNLNNFIKVNNIEATPQTGTDVVPFKDGHHISIRDEGITRVDIENGAENVYTPYYCFVDTKLPDVSFNYSNSNASQNRRVGNVTTDSKGAKTQSIYEGVFKDQVQVNFGANENEGPETATYTFNGQTCPLTSGTWLNEEGRYELKVTDAAGNTTICTFDIDKSNSSLNLDRLTTDKSYKITKWYLTSIPYNYKNSGSYSFKEQQDALNFAQKIERENHVTHYFLNNLEDFVDTHLVAKGNNIKLGDYWYYKSIYNPDIYVYYFDENSLIEALTYYSQDFVTEHIFKINSALYPNDYGQNIDESVIDNIIVKDDIIAYLANNFVFRSDENNESYKIYCDYAEDDIEQWKELQYNKKFSSQVNSHGLYKIKEVDFVGHETFYYVYIDLQAPMLDVEFKVYGKSKQITQTISTNDIPQNNELVFYYETFKINNVIEDDKWWILEVQTPKNSTLRYTFLDELPCFEDYGQGEYKFTITDRNENVFKFNVFILGKAPEAIFTTINAGTQLKVDIKCTEEYNSIMDLKIYRNNVCLNSQSGYDEYPDKEDNDLIFVNKDILSYIFNKGGIYKVEIEDFFGRTISYEFRFEKDLPTGELVGVEHNGRTKDEVKFIYNSSKYYVVIEQNNKTFSPQQEQSNNITTLTFTPQQEAEDNYSIKLIDNSDNENYNIYIFTIKTISPIIHLFGVDNNGKTAGNVYATWDSGEENYTATFELNSKIEDYKKGQVLSVEGKYTLTLYDELGNSAFVKFEIDKNIDFLILDSNGKTYTINEIENINFDIKLVNQEPLEVSILKDGKSISYDFGLFISEEGSYEVVLKDEFNNSVYFTFIIDKTPPVATLYGVEEYGKTNKTAWVTSNESNLSCWYVLNGKDKTSYKLGEEVFMNGKYIISVSDQAKNITSFEFEIDKGIAFDINTYDGGISNGDVRIIAYENLKIFMTKDNQFFDYSFEQILNEDGEYSFTLIDDLGNKYTSYFTIITKKKQNLKHILQSNIQIKNIVKDEEDYTFENLENSLYLYDEGVYTVYILDNNTNKEYSFSITLDTTPPTLEIVGVANGGTTKNNVVLKNVSETPYTLTIFVDGVKFDYKLGEKIEKSGRFEIILMDEAGNTTTYSFEKVYSFNAAAIGVLSGLGVLVVIVIILLISSRHRFYKKEEVEEEETIIEENLDNDSENSENS